MARYIDGDKLVLMLSALADQLINDADLLDNSIYTAVHENETFIMRMQAEFALSLMRAIEATIKS